MHGTILRPIRHILLQFILEQKYMHKTVYCAVRKHQKFSYRIFIFHLNLNTFSCMGGGVEHEIEMAFHKSLKCSYSLTR